MAGSTNNTDLLKALNQAVKAINDLVLGGDTVVVEAPNVTVRPNITVNCNCGCGGGGGTKLPDSPVSEGDTPPEGYEPDPNIDQRKCKAANYIYDKIYETVQALNRAHSDTIQNALLAGWMALAGALVGSYFPVIGTVAGAVAGIAIAIFTTVDAGYILDAMNNRKDDIICGLYNAGDTEAAKSSFLDILADEGVTGVAYYEFMGFFLIADVLKVLFQAVDWVSEATIGAYAGGSEGCGGCGETTPYPDQIIMSVGTVESTGYHSWRMTAGYQYDLYYIQGSYNIGSGDHISTFVVNNWANTQYQDFRFYSQTGYGNEIYEGDVNQSPLITDSWIITSATMFTIDISLA